MFKIIKGDAPSYLTEAFQSISSVHNHTTKQSSIGDLFTNRGKKAYFLKTFRYYGSKV